MLVALGVRAIKIASPELTNLPVLAVAAETGLPLIVSTGAADAAEIDAAVEWIAQRGGAQRLVLLHCVSSYPADERTINLRRMTSIARRTRCLVGLSDHTTGTDTGALAAAVGATVLEKHFTLDKRQPGPDHAFSLEPAELADYVRNVRRAEVLLGDGRLEPDESEREVRKLTRSSVVSAVDIACGETITDAMLTIKRPGTGIAPADLPRVPGRVARVDIPADTPIEWGMLQ